MTIQAHPRLSRAVLLTVTAGLLAGCVAGGDSPVPEDGPGPGDGPGSVDMSRIDDAIMVTPVLDADSAVTEAIGPEGGEVVTTAADGTVFELRVPKDSLALPTAITMTPLSDVEGLPFGDGSVHGVDLEPSGLTFAESATLSITPPEPIPYAEQLPFGYTGSELSLAVLSPETEDIEVVVDHFSGYGVSRGMLGDSDEVLQRIGASEEARIQAEMSRLLYEARQRELAGEEPDPAVWEQMEAYFEEFDELVVKPRMAAISESCLAGRSILRWLLAHSRGLQLLGQEDPVNERFTELGDLVHTVCMDEEYEMCVQDHVIHRLPEVYLSARRGHELMNFPTAGVVAELEKRTEDCVRFELEFTTTGSGEKTGQGSYWYQDTATFVVDVEFDAGNLEFRPSTTTMTSDDPAYSTDLWSCSTTPVGRWSAPARFVSMHFSIEGAGLSEELGYITDLEAEVELPTEAISMGTVSCGGTDPIDEGGEGLSAPVVYRLAHEDEVIRDWSIPAGEVYATATWQGGGRTDLAGGIFMAWDESGTATLTHKPR